MKNILKSVFIALFPMLAIIGLTLGIKELITEGPGLISIGLFIQSITIIILFAGLLAVPQARTSRYLHTHSIIILIGFTIGMIAVLNNSTSLFEKFLLTSLFVSWFLYVYWYSVLDDKKESAFQKERNLPDIYLENTEHEKISMQSFIGAPTIFMFYRGNWCPLCMAQINEIADQYKKLEDMGVNMVLISPQPHKFTRSLAKRFDIGFHFLIDVDHKVSKQFGIFTKNGIPAGLQLLGYESDTVLPTIIITDSDGKIIFHEVADNYRVRPEPETFIRVIEKHEEKIREEKSEK